MKITFIGAGNMGGAIIKGLLNTTKIKPKDVFVIDPNEEIRQAFEKLGCNTFDTCNKETLLNTLGNITVVAVKPWQWEHIANILIDTKTLVVSVIAGLSVDTIKMQLRTEKVAAVIPNIAVEFGAGFTAVNSNNQKTADEVINLFAHLGRAVQVNEKELQVAMALGSCGLAYALRYAHANMNGATEMGMSPANAQKIMAATLRGAAALLEKEGTHPEVEIDKITTPGGITIKGLNKLEEHNFSHAVIQALKHSK